MIKGLALLLLACCQLAGASTYTVNPAQSTSTIQRIITRALAGDTVSFTAGTYTMSARLSLKCGVTYTGPVAVPATAILNGASAGVSTSNGLFTLNTGSGYVNPCTAATTIEYLNFSGATIGIYVNTSFTNLTIQYNQCTNVPGNTTLTACMVFSAGSGNTTPRNSVLSNTTITHNQMGDANSCISPTNVMADVDSPEDYNGACNGMVFFSSINGLTISYNNIYHVAEGVHINCFNGSDCSSTDSPEGPNTSNMTVEYNDFSGIHRIGWEEQAEDNTNVVIQYNDTHDWINAYFASQGWSMACCSGVLSVSPYLNFQSNVMSENGAVYPTYGQFSYTIEAWGLKATYLHNWSGITRYVVCNGCPGQQPGIVWGYGEVASISYNTLCGPMWYPSSFIASEGLLDEHYTPTLTGNVTAQNCSAATSFAPTISPSSGVQSFPLTVSLADPGYGPTAALPNGNTGIWYTTDGSTPVPGSGTAKYLASGGTFTLASAGTVKAVGMWGAANQPTSYPSGYGFAPSAVKTAHYTSGVASQQRRPR